MFLRVQFGRVRHLKCSINPRKQAFLGRKSFESKLPTTSLRLALEWAVNSVRTVLRWVVLVVQVLVLAQALVQVIRQIVEVHCLHRSAVHRMRVELAEPIQRVMVRVQTKILKSVQVELVKQMVSFVSTELPHGLRILRKVERLLPNHKVQSVFPIQFR
jgi:hypothetical protein